MPLPHRRPAKERGNFTRSARSRQQAQRSGIAQHDGAQLGLVFHPFAQCVGALALLLRPDAHAIDVVAALPSLLADAAYSLLPVFRFYLVGVFLVRFAAELDPPRPRALALQGGQG